MLKKGRGWYRKDFARREEVNWSAWLQGYFFTEGTNLNDGQKDEDRIMIRNYQELYTRDKMINCLGDISNKKGLDVGGGAGVYSIVLALIGAQMSVQDLSSESINSGKLLSKKIGVDVEYKVGDAQNLQFKDKSFDFCISNDFFEHISKEQKIEVIREINRVLKPGGQLIIKTPNLSYLKSIIALKRFLAIIRFRTPFIFIPHTRNNPDCEHHGLTTFNELEIILEDNFFFNFKRIPLLCRRINFPRIISKLIYGFWPLTEHIIITCNKSVFVPIGNSLQEIGGDWRNLES
tara:strand:+ start:611 stop:1483 length:873 start_codon:yes stop_codon:yes gene_type:complete